MIQGVGVPNSIKNAGVIYLNKQTGIKYIQTSIPQGNNWELYGNSSSVTITEESVNLTINKIYSMKFVVNYSQFVSLMSDSLVNIGYKIGEINHNYNGVIKLNFLKLFSNTVGTKFNNINGNLQLIISNENVEKGGWVVNTNTLINQKDSRPYTTTIWGTNTFSYALNENEPLDIKLINLGSTEITGGSSDSYFEIYMIFSTEAV